MNKKIAIIQGHPDRTGNHYLNALAASYAEGAAAAGNTVEMIEISKLDFPLLRSKHEYENGDAPDAIRKAQEIIKNAGHLVIFYPLWLGDMPALLKGFLEQVFRPRFISDGEKSGKSEKIFQGKSARIVVTMGMPAFFYRWFYRAHTLKNLKRNILGFCGFAPVRESLFGMIENVKDEKRRKWLGELYELGFRGR
jgi:putative NADPH-quinone reductase